jgi:hypothetical protein
VYGLDTVAVLTDLPRFPPCFGLPDRVCCQVILEQPLLGVSHELLPLAFSLLGCMTSCFCLLLSLDALGLVVGSKLDDALLNLPE